MLRLRLWTLDARVRDGGLLTDRDRLRRILREEAVRGGATVVGERFCVFDNGAVTGVLVLAQSHLSVHTWPEHSLASVDLLCCGGLDGEAVVHAIEARLGAERARVSCLER